jgi:hypothetical protein
VLDDKRKIYSTGDNTPTRSSAAGGMKALSILPRVRPQGSVRANDERLKNFYGATEATAAADRNTVESSYATPTEKIEEHIASRGRVLLSVDATDGGTIFSRR